MEEPQAFIDIMRKCRSPYGFVKYRRKNGKHPKNSVYLRGNDVRIQVYDKFNELIKNKNEKAANELEYAKGIVRFEVQSDKGKLAQFLQGQGDDDIFASLLRLSLLASDILVLYAKKIFGASHHLPVESMELIIANSCYKEKTKRIMYRFLHHLRSAWDVDDAIQKMEIGSSEKNNAAQIVKKFENLGINTIPLSEKSAQYMAGHMSLAEMTRQAFVENPEYFKELMEQNKVCSDYCEQCFS